MFPFDDYEEARDFLYGIFDEEEQINDKLILFAKSYIPGNYSRHYKGTMKEWGNEDAHISESRYSSDYCPGVLVWETSYLIVNVMRVVVVMRMVHDTYWKNGLAEVMENALYPRHVNW